MYEISSGSFIGVLNLTIDKAPTNPKDKAKEDFTTVIIIDVVRLITGKTLANDLGFENVLDLSMYILEITRDNRKHIIIDKIKEPVLKELYSKFILLKISLSFTIT
tara:strand:- start:36 stop:353 length:318 start_codon:yes stop_codon:yes gene_type:complete